MNKVIKGILSLCLVASLMLANVCSAYAVSDEEHEKALIQRVTTLDSVPEDAIIISEDYEVLIVEAEDVNGVYVSTSDVYELVIYHAETYSASTGLGYVVRASCNNPACQISYLSGTATVYSYDDYEYGSYDMYTRNWLVTNSISSSKSTGLIFYPGTTGLYVGYSFYIGIVNGVVLNGGNFRIVSDQLTIPG